MQHRLMVLFTALLLFALTALSAGGAQAQGSAPGEKTWNPVSSAQNPAESSDSPSKVTNLLQDPSFEASFPNGPYWFSTSTNFPTSLCTLAACGNGAGTAGPRTGGVWAWLGGVAPQNETASVYQSVIFPACGATLQFYLWIGAATPGSDANDRFVVRVDNTQVFTANATQRSSYPNYKLVTVNLNAFADGNPHQISFWGFTTGQLVTFNLDDIALSSGACVSISGNAGLPSVSLRYNNVIQQTVVTLANGSYSFNVPLHWTGTVVPSGQPTYPGVTFSPASRSYSNLTTNQAGQNYAPSFSISGNAGAGGVTLGYTVNGTPRTAISQPNGAYSFPVPAHWTGTVTPSPTCFTFNPPNQSYNDVLASQATQNYSATFQAGAGCADVRTLVGGTERGRFGLAAGASTRASFSGVNDGPVKIVSSNSVPLIGAERVIYKVNNVNTSFSEMMGLPASQLDTIYWLPWYNNVNLDTQLRIANVSGSSATVHIFIGGAEVTPGGGVAIPAGQSARLSYTGVDDGPVQIVSSQNIVAAERVIYKVNNVNTSFTEMMALPASQLDTVYWLPWYNNVDLDTQLRIANVSNAAATVHVFIGGTEVTPPAGVSLATGASTRVSYTGVNDGPVRVESDQPIVAAERVIYKVNNVYTSFSEMMALPDGQLNTTYWLPWYNNVNLDTQLRIANVSNAAATVHIFIGGTEVTPGGGVGIPAGESARLSYTGVDDGPVQIVSNQNIVAAERVIFRVNSLNTSFSEMMGLPDNFLNATFWLPWYNNVDLDTQLRFGAP